MWMFGNLFIQTHTTFDNYDYFSRRKVCRDVALRDGYSNGWKVGIPALLGRHRLCT